MHRSSMSCVSSISTYTTRLDDDSDSDAEELRHQVPPPPPHIELLNLGGDARGYCISHVISYLDDDGRISAAASCVYLKQAVNEWYNTLVRITPRARAGELCLERLVVTPTDKELIDSNKAPTELKSQKEPEIMSVAVPTATAAKCRLEEDQKQTEAAEYCLNKTREEAEQKLEKTRRVAAEREALEKWLEQERIEHEPKLVEKRRAGRKSRQRLATEVEARQAELENIEQEEQEERRRRSLEEQKRQEEKEQALQHLAVTLVARQAESKIVEREEQERQVKGKVSRQERQEGEERARQRLAASVAAKQTELEKIGREQQLERQRRLEQRRQEEDEEERSRHKAREKAAVAQLAKEKKLKEETLVNERLAADVAARRQAELDNIDRDEQVILQRRLQEEQKRQEEEEERACHKSLEEAEAVTRLAKEKRVEEERLEEGRLVAEVAARRQAELDNIERDERLACERRLREEQKRQEEEEERARQKSLEEAQAGSQLAKEKKLEEERLEKERLVAEVAERRRAELDNIEREERLACERRLQEEQKRQEEEEERASPELLEEAAVEGSQLAKEKRIEEERLEEERQVELDNIDREERLAYEKEELKRQEEEEERARHKAREKAAVAQLSKEKKLEEERLEEERLVAEVAARRQAELDNIEHEERLACERRLQEEQKRQEEEEEGARPKSLEEAQAGAHLAKEKRVEEERLEEERLTAQMFARRQAELDELEKATLVEKLRLERLERERVAAEQKLLKHIEREERLDHQRRMLEDQTRRDAAEKQVRRKARENAAAHIDIRNRLERERLDKEKLAETEIIERLDRTPIVMENAATAVSVVEPIVVQNRNILQEIDDLEEVTPKLSPPRTSRPSSLDEEEHQFIVPEQDNDDVPVPLLAVSSASILSDLEKPVHKPSLLSAATPIVLDEVEEHMIVPNYDVHDVPTALLADFSTSNLSSSDEENTELDDELVSISTKDMKAQSEKFIAGVSSSGNRTPLSFLVSKNYTDSTIGTASSSDPEEEKPQDTEHENELDNWLEDDPPALPTVSHLSNMTPPPITPSTPNSDASSPASLNGATRLVMGSKSHLGDGSRVHIFQRVQQIEKIKHRAKDGMLSNVNKSSSKISSPNSVARASGFESWTHDKRDHAKVAHPSGPSTREQQPHPQPSAPLATFSRLRDKQNMTSKEEIPFDEMPLVSKSMSLESKPCETSLNSSQKIDKSKTLGEDGDGEETVRKITTQLSNAGPFGETSQVFGKTPRLVTSFMTEIMDSAKDVVSHFYLNGNKVIHNKIDDDGPIKIGDKYYSHNEAMQKWRKAKVKVKLEDQCHAVDEENMEMESLTFFERITLFQEEPKEMEVDTTDEDYEPEQGIAEKGKEKAVSINEFFTKYKMIELEQRSTSVDESTVMAGNVVKYDEERDDSDKLSSLTVGDERKEDKVIHSEATHSSYQVGHNITDTESGIKSTEGIDDAEADTTVSRFIGSISEASQVESENGAIELERKIELTRTRAAPTLPRSSGNKMTKHIVSNSGTFHDKHETDSVAGNDSLPSHMGSMYGVEITSLRGMNANFINGKSSEQVEIGGGKSIREDCEQSLLGSQYGTEVVFKAKKVAAARKPRTLANHNMGVKTSKQTNTGGSKGAAVKQTNMGTKGTSVKQVNVGVKGATLKEVNIGAKGAAVKQVDMGGKGTTQTTTRASSTVKETNKGAKVTTTVKRNKGSPLSKQHKTSATSSPGTTPSRSASSRIKFQKKPNLPLKKLKLSIRRATTRSS